MGVEIERKFLVATDEWRGHVSKVIEIAQGYLSADPARTCRVRLAGDEGFITIKGQPSAQDPLATPEFEYAIPAGEARALLKLCLPGAIEKTRHHVVHQGHTWEVDVFHGDNAGLTLAEIELTASGETFAAPAWLGAEVTADHRYKNASLSKNPYKTWAKSASAKPPAP